MDNFIEVVGEGSYEERISTYRAEINLSVRAAQAETAIREVGELRNQCIIQLRQAGMADAELIEGGAEVGRSWYERKKTGQEAVQKILIECSDLARIQAAVAALEGLFENQRYTFQFSMNRPGFEIPADSVILAQRAAMQDARSQAEVLAQACGVKIMHVAQVEELTAKTSRSGMYGDEDWGGYAMAGAAASAPIQLEAGSRKNTVRYRVRFATEKTI
ncbi:MAG: hypothetical protein RL748_265 [Pseudomonadota bacterium]